MTMNIETSMMTTTTRDMDSIMGSGIFSITGPLTDKHSLGLSSQLEHVRIYLSLEKPDL